MPPAKSKPTTARATSSSAPSTKGRVAKPLRSLVVLTMVGGLVATVAIPAFAATAGAGPEEAVTLQQMAVDDAQTFVAASDANASELSRESYAATTAEEIDKKKAEEAAAERARQVAKLASTSSRSSVPINIALTSPGTGEVRWPILNFTKGRGLWDSGYHQGVDLLAPQGTPIYAAAAGVVKVSQESYGGYGVGISIDHVIGGQQVNTLYGHMTYGSRQVSVGQTVEAGQLIGLVGSTGSSTANHLHFEVHINGSVVDPWAWLQANAG
ncbi:MULTISPECIES: M23 family metallopeptidase [unclassified Microbacterium]|uniref:M23 family metallopeptidase n=1 Tax=unclassified Microbacterium TaxID=2609290 RepID=UPI003447A651